MIPIIFKNATRSMALLGGLALSSSAFAQNFNWSTSFSPSPNVFASSVTAGAQNAAPSTSDFFATFTQQTLVATDTAPTNITFGTIVSNMVNNPDNVGDFGSGTFNSPFTMDLTIFNVTKTFNLSLVGVLNSNLSDSSSLHVAGLPISAQVFNTNQGTFTVENFEATGIGTPGKSPSGISADVFGQPTSVTPEATGILQFLPGLLPFALVAARRRMKKSA